MTSTPNLTGRFVVRIGKDVLTYSKVSEIPAEFDNLVAFEPTFPKPPHTLTDHAVMASYPSVMASLMMRERKYASRH